MKKCLKVDQSSPQQGVTHLKMALTTFRLPVLEKNNHILGLFGDFSSSFELGIKVVDSINQ